MCQRKGVLLLRRYEFGMTMRERTRMSLEERPCVEAEEHSVAECLDQYVVRQASPTHNIPQFFQVLKVHVIVPSRFRRAAAALLGGPRSWDRQESKYTAKNNLLISNI